MSIPGAAEVQDLIAACARSRDGAVTILEAGSGRFRHFEYPATARITGLDISADQLAANDYAHEKIVGDIQTWSTSRQWDVVVNVYVLEHVDDPRRAVANLLSWTRPGGLLVIAVPNLFSLKGLVTKATPYRFHDWFYRWIYRRPYAIFPTTLKLDVAPRRLRQQLSGHTVVLERHGQETLAAPFQPFYRLAIGVLRVLSLGRWRPQDANYVLVVRRAVDAAASSGEE